MKPLAVTASGLFNAVGLNSDSACAAIRCGISATAETAFMVDGDWLLGCAAPVDPPLRGVDRLAHMAGSAVGECLPKTKYDPGEIALILLIAEKDRPARFPDLDKELFQAVQEKLKIAFHPKSTVIARGRTGIAHGLQIASRLVHEGGVSLSIVAGADSLLVGGTIETLAEQGRLLTPKNSDGFIPGEAAAAVALARPSGRGPELVCLGLGQATEPATVRSEQPRQADGLAAAIRAALADGGRTYEDVDYRLADVSGEQYGFKEAQLGIGRTLRGKMKPKFDLWHPADCIGETGAAIGPCLIAVALAAARKRYAPGRGALCHVSADDGDRAAFILRWEERP